MIFGSRHVDALGVEYDRYQQRLHRDAVVIELGLQFFVDDALVRRVHVHDHQSMFVAREHVDTRELRERETQRRYFGVGLGALGGGGPGLHIPYRRRRGGGRRCGAAEQRFVRGIGLRDSERHAMLGRGETCGCRTRDRFRQRISGAAGRACERAADRMEHELVYRL